MRIYLDNHTAARPSAQVVEKMTPFLRDHFALLSSPYHIGQEQLKDVESAYASLYALLGARNEDTILFCSSGAEAINHILFSTYLDFTRRSGKNHYITTVVDEAPLVLGASRLEPLGVTSKLCEVDACGQMTKQKLIEAISPRTALVSISYANGLTGVIQPVEEIAQICKERDIIFHLDVTHVLGKLFLDLEGLKPDLVTFNGDSLHAPRGCGALYIRSPYKLSPFIIGGNDQGSMRAGSVNVASLIGFGVAATELIENRDLLCTEIARLRDQLEERIKEELPNCVVLFQESCRLPNCTAIAFPGICNEALLYLLNKKGLYATIGGGNFQNISSVLKACGLSSEISDAAISFSLARDTTEEEVDLAVAIISSSVRKLLQIAEHLS